LEEKSNKGIGLVIITIVLVLVALITVGVLFLGGVSLEDRSINNAVSSFDETYSDTIEIEIGRVHSTWWFNFTIHSVDVVQEYAGHTAAPGHRLWKVEITQTGTFFDPILMGTFDWFMRDDSFRSDIFPHMGFLSRDEMMPEEFWLDRGQSETHIMLFEVPLDTRNLTLNFIEFAEFETGARFLADLQ